jgi:hypothetical protein
VPLVGTATLVATAGGWAAPAALSAPAAPESARTGSLGPATPALGTFESCDAHFGFGKELVSFEVVDQSGSDGIAHAVPGDTQVVLVLENDQGQTLECTPVELTQDDWDQQFGVNDPEVPPFPGPGHYVYPSIAGGRSVDGLDNVVSVGYRVVGIPGLHTLVSPTGIKELLQSQLNPESLLFLDQIDPHVLSLIFAGASIAASGAYQDAVAACNGDGTLDETDPDLIAAIGVLAAYVDEADDVTCDNISALNLDVSIRIGLEHSIANTETITLAPPQAPPTTPPPTTPPTTAPPAVSPAATPVEAAPTFTG